METPLISVIIPVYKTEKYLRQCVNSVINQTYQNLEIILIDDGSPDNCPAICDQFALEDPRVVVIHQTNQGQAAARNAALDICGGEYITFVDSDDWIESIAFDRAMSFVKENDLDVVFYAANIVEGERVTRVDFRYYPQNTVLPAKEVLLQTLTNHIEGQPCFKMYHSKCWKNVRFPSGRIYEDLAISHCPFLYAERKVGFLDMALYNYRQNPLGTSFSVNPVKPYHIFLAFRDHYDYARKHCPEVEEVCLMNTASFAISAVFNYYSHGSEKLKSGAADAEAFLYENMQAVKRCRGYLKTRKLALDVFFASKPCFCFLARLCDKVIKQS